MLLAMISSDENTKWDDVFLSTKVRAWWVLSGKDPDFEYEKSDMKISKDKGKEKMKEKVKGQGVHNMLSPKETTALLGSSPRFDYVGMNRGFVNPYAKPQWMITKIIKSFLEPGETILVFFFGGQVTKTSFVL